MGDWLLVPCPGKRTGELLRLLKDAELPRSQVCVVTTDPDPVPKEDIVDCAAQLVRLGSEINYAKWLNAGIACIMSVDASARYVFITGSDTRCNRFTLPTLVQGALLRNLVMSGPDHWGMGDTILDPRKPRRVNYRVPPEYFLLDLHTGIRFDAAFRWWYSEDDLEMQARQIGAVGLTTNVYAGQPDAPYGHVMSAEVALWVKEDRAKFVRKWRREPW